MATKLNITELDFASNKQQLINYLKSQTQFKDYDFEGSNLNVLLDVLSYNTYQNNFYTNMAINEMFLDSAVLPNSVISHAKELNYLPSSRKSARASVRVTIRDTTITGQTITIPQFAAFKASFQGENYEFVTDKAYVAKKTETGVFVADNIEIFEGQMLTSFEREGYFVDEDGILTVILSNENADIDSLEVFVDAEFTEDENIFTRKNDIFGVGPEDKVFYVEPYYDGRYKIYFGNNVFGIQPDEYEDIRVKYRICSGAEPNGASVFTIQITTTGTTEVETIQAALGGEDAESLEKIRYFAPKALQIQERAITTSDYEVLLKQQFPEIKAVSAYGGENLNPPQFGRVAISVYLGEAEETLSNTLVNTYLDYLSDKTPLAIEPTFVPSEFVYGQITIRVNYNPKLTTKNSDYIAQLVRDTIQAYSEASLDNFNTTLRLSNLSSNIDAADVSIQSNAITAKPIIEYTPDLNIKSNPIFKFGTPLVKPYPFRETNGFAEYKPSVISGQFSV
ncbi:baseplate J/gp47 family protein, partial [bacterium]|nr:baseplate J/gp47 family protein [bacterium]